MKKYLMLMFFSALCFITYGSKKNIDTKSSNQKEYVEVLYFHGKQRCATCRAIQELTQEVLEKDFSQEIKNGKIKFKIIDISKKEGEAIADLYEVTWSSLFLNKWSNGKENRVNMTDFGFKYAKNSPDTFKAEIKKKLTELLK